MSRRTIRTIIDDFDGTEGAETRSFSLGGQDYEIDLVEAHWRELLLAVEPFTDAARNPSAPGRRTGRTAAHRRHTAAVRAWAKKRYPDLPERGRIPDHIVAEYDRQHGTARAA